MGRECITGGTVVVLLVNTLTLNSLFYFLRGAAIGTKREGRVLVSFPSFLLTFSFSGIIFPNFVSSCLVLSYASIPFPPFMVYTFFYYKPLREFM